MERGSVIVQSHGVTAFVFYGDVGLTAGTISRSSVFLPPNWGLAGRVLLCDVDPHVGWVPVPAVGKLGW